MKFNKHALLFVLATALLATGCTPKSSSSEDVSVEQSITETSQTSQEEKSSSQGQGKSSSSKGASSSSKPSSSSSKSTTSVSVTPTQGIEITTDLTKTYDIHTSNQNKYLNFTGDYYHITKNDLDSFGATGQSENSAPQAVSLAWNHTPAAGKTVSYYGVKISTKEDLSDGYEIKGSTSKSLSLYNVFLGNNYFQVVAHYADGTAEGSEVKILKVTEKGPRNLKIGNMSNCRDMGGKTTIYGGKLKQGIIFRTCGNKFDYSTQINAEGKTVMLDYFKVKTEINVADGTSYNCNLTGTNVVNCFMDYGATPYSNISRNAEPLRKVYSYLADSKNYPIFYHCRIGTDRTGLVGITLDGLLGVSFQETLQDYGFSNFGKIGGQRYSNKPSDPDGDDCAKYVDEILKMPGANWQEQCYNALRQIGIPASQLDAIINNMTEGNKPTASVSCAYANANNLTNNGGTVKTASDYKNPDKYIEISSGKSVSMKATTAAGKSNVVVYLGCTDSSDSKKLASGISLKIDGAEKTIVDKTYFKAGFGTTKQTNRTGYMFNVLGEYDLTAGEHTFEIAGKNSDKFNVASIAVYGGATGGEGGQGEGGEGGQTTHTHAWGSATTVSDSGKTPYSKQTCECGQTKLTIDATKMTLNGTNKSGTPSGFIKLSATDENITATFNYSEAKTGKIYIDGVMDSWSGNKSKTMYTGKSSTTANGNFKLTVNGTAVDFSDKKSTTFETLFGSGSNATLGSDYSQQAEVEIGSMSLKNGENTIVFQRIDSYNILAKNFVIVLDK